MLKKINKQSTTTTAAKLLITASPKNDMITVVFSVRRCRYSAHIVRMCVHTRTNGGASAGKWCDSSLVEVHPFYASNGTISLFNLLLCSVGGVISYYCYS